VSLRNAIVLGKGRTAIAAAEVISRDRDLELACVVPAVPEPLRHPLGRWARTRRIAVVDTGRIDDVPSLLGDDWEAELLVSAFYNRIIPADVLVRCVRAVNVHPSPLPRYRGVLPVNFALQNGENAHGVTIHELTAGIDEGPVLAQALFPVFPAEDGPADLYERALDFGELLIAHTLPRLARLTGVPQDESAATYYGSADRARLEPRWRFTPAQAAHWAEW
jgi:methionyl-tRNA formyltransferase